MAESRRAYSVLVVDDDPDILLALQDLFEFEGFHVDCAETSRDAVSSLKRNRYHVVLLDLDLPDGDGHSILEELQTRRSAPAVIVLTATTAADRKLRALEQGAFAYVTKPYNPEALRTILYQAIGL